MLLHWYKKKFGFLISFCGDLLPFGPISGSEFLIPVTGYYCQLCHEFFGDQISAEQHVKSHPHNEKYKVSIWAKSCASEVCHNLWKLILNFSIEILLIIWNWIDIANISCFISHWDILSMCSITKDEIVWRKQILFPEDFGEHWKNPWNVFSFDISVVFFLKRFYSHRTCNMSIFNWVNYSIKNGDIDVSRWQDRRHLDSFGSMCFVCLQQEFPVWRPWVPWHMLTPFLVPSKHF